MSNNERMGEIFSLVVCGYFVSSTHVVKRIVKTIVVLLGRLSRGL